MQIIHLWLECFLEFEHNCHKLQICSPQLFLLHMKVDFLVRRVEQTRLFLFLNMLCRMNWNDKLYRLLVVGATKFGGLEQTKLDDGWPESEKNVDVKFVDVEHEC